MLSEETKRLNRARKYGDLLRAQAPKTPKSMAINRTNTKLLHLADSPTFPPKSPEIITHLQSRKPSLANPRKLG